MLWFHSSVISETLKDRKYYDLFCFIVCFGFSFGIGLGLDAVLEVDSDIFVLPYSFIFRGTRRLCIGELELFTDLF